MRYILLVKEDHEYKALETDEERRSFIERFWTALDPAPDTATNERRVEFWRRVEEANRLFREGLAPGWKTDRGKVHILLGPPDRRDLQGAYDVWKYVALPEAGAAPEITIRFRRNSDGEFTMGRGALEYWDPHVGSEGPAVGETFLAVRGEAGSLEIMQGRIRVTEFPRPDVSAEIITAPLVLHPRFDYYSAEKEGTRVVVTLAVPVDEFEGPDGRYASPEMQMSVTLEEAKSGKAVGNLTESLVVTTVGSKSPQRPTLFQGSFLVEPGAYKAVFTILDRKSHRGASRTETIAAPNFSRGLSLSTLVVGRLPEGPRGGATPGRPEATALIPDPLALFRPGETVSFAYQVYNARLKGGVPDLSVEYRFSLDLTDGPRQVGKPVVLPHLASESLAYSLVLQGWPEGAYRVRVQVADNRSGASATHEESFRVAARRD